MRECCGTGAKGDSGGAAGSPSAPVGGLRRGRGRGSRGPVRNAEDENGSDGDAEAGRPSLLEIVDKALEGFRGLQRHQPRAGQSVRALWQLEAVEIG
jgi:hypothetical protein